MPLTPCVSVVSHSLVAVLSLVPETAGSVRFGYVSCPSLAVCPCLPEPDSATALSALLYSSVMCPSALGGCPLCVVYVRCAAVSLPLVAWLLMRIGLRLCSVCQCKRAVGLAVMACRCFCLSGLYMGFRGGSFWARARAVCVCLFHGLCRCTVLWVSVRLVVSF